MHATHPPTLTAAQIRTRTPVQLAAALFGFFFLLIGVAGFSPVTTMHFSTIEMGFGSGAMLLGIFQVSFVTNILHVLFWHSALGLSRAPDMARWYLLIGGAVYGVLWLFGLLVSPDSMASSLPMNLADTWLDFALALTMVGLGLLLSRTEHD